MPDSPVYGEQKRRAIAYYIAHPDASQKDVMNALKISYNTASSARRSLVAKGILNGHRRGSAIPPKSDDPPPPPPPKSTEPSAPVPVVKPGETLDDTAMREIATVDMALDDDETDEDAQKRMLAMVKSIVFNPKLHPDTRLTATQVWQKIKERALRRDLGPGKPMTYEAARDRLSDQMTACGLVLTIDALFKTYRPDEVAAALSALLQPEKGATDEGRVPANSGEDAPSSTGTPEPLRSDADVQVDGEGRGERGMGPHPPTDEHQDPS